MSTDYGIKCVDCDKVFIEDNLYRHHIYPLLRKRTEIAKFWLALVDVFEIDVMISNDWLSDLPGCFEFISAHHEHKLVCVDEYGNIHPENE